MKQSKKIYLAGKIERNCWRHNIVDSLREYEGSLDWSIYKKSIFGKHHYVGPFFIGCDHGCYHGEGTHGNISDSYCIGQKAPTEKQVLEKCLKAIDDCNFFFAWIDRLDCYGTIAEIGYAFKSNKPIYLAGNLYLKDLWFIYKMATKTCFYRKTPKEALQYFLYGEKI